MTKTFLAVDLTHAVLWPQHKAALVQLICPEGECLGQFTLSEPLRGSELRRVCPDGYFVSVDKVHVARLTGPIVRTTVLPFDTAVQTERPTISLEERMLRLERKAAWADREREKAVRERDKAMKERESDEVVEDDEPAPAPDTGATEPESEPDASAGSESDKAASGAAKDA